VLDKEHARMNALRKIIIFDDAVAPMACEPHGVCKVRRHPR
jgi:hypothetical protein